MKLKGEKLFHHREYCKFLDIRPNDKINLFSLWRIGDGYKLSIGNSNSSLVNIYKGKVDLVLLSVHF